MTAKPKRAATLSEWKRRNKFQELAACGVGGERDAAIKSLADLEAKRDFSGERPTEATDLFHGMAVTKSDTACPVATFDTRGDADASSFVKWALSSRFDLGGVWRDDGAGKVTLWLNVSNDSVHGLAHVARHIGQAFETLWREFNALPGATKSDARLFMRALYDGMMNDERKAGESLPLRTLPRTKRTRGKRKAIVNAPALAVHPYALGVDLGRSIRMTLPIGEIVHALQDATKPAESHATT